MRANDKKIKEFERRLMEDKKWLHDLMYNSDSDDKLYQKKLNYYKSELKYMEERLSKLKEEVSVDVIEPIKDNLDLAKDNNGLDKAEEKNYNDMLIGTHLSPDGIPVSAATVSNKNENSLSVDIANNKKIENVCTSNVNNKNDVKSILFTDIKDIKDLEKLVGKSFMGIAASVLIFTGLFLFAKVFMKCFNDEFKMFVMYSVSVAFLAVGLIKMHRNPEDKFFITITSCGIGALYISLIITNIYFNAIGDVALYVLLAIWSIGVCFLSRHKNEMFMVIGNLGITISLFFGISLCAGREDASMFLALVIYYIISASVFNVLHFRRDFSKNIFSHAVNSINIVLLYVGTVECVQEGVYLTSILVLLVMLVYLGIMLYSTFENDKYGFFICYAVSMISLCNQLDWMAKGNLWGIIVYVLNLAIVVFLERRKWNNEWSKVIALGTGILFMVIGVAQNKISAGHGLPFMIVIPLIIYGYYRIQPIFKYAAVGILLVYEYIYYLYDMVVYDLDKVPSSGERLFVGMGIYILIFICINKFKNQYNDIYKYIVHIETFLLLFFIGIEWIDDISDEYEMALAIGYVMATLYNIVMMKYFRKDLLTGETEENHVFSILNAIMMIIGLGIISSVENEVLHIFVIIMAIVSFMVNSKRYLEIKNKMWPGIYVGTKFIVLLIVILASFEAENFVISILCFVFAIACIALGFIRWYKSLRVFGLILSIISIFKLLVIDIHYENSIGNALSFFISGILCFVISMIYNYIDKKLPKE